MKNNYLILPLLVSIVMLTTFGCVEQIDADIEDLQSQIDELKLSLESNTAIEELLIEDGQLLLVFTDGTNISTALPDNPIPYIGDNGNWFVGDTDLGSPAVAEVPTIGGNGNWIIDGEDSGISAEATNGDDGEDGTNGTDGTNGIDGANGENGLDGDGVASVTYDQITGILEITLDSGTVYSFELYLEDSLKAVKLEDLNGEYLLSTIYNGDLPFAAFTYDANNRLTDVSYFTTILNEPVEYMKIHKDLDANGNITAQTVIEYATKDIAIAEDEYPLAYGLNGVVYYDLDDAFDLLFPTGITGFSGAGDDFFDGAYNSGFSTFIGDTYIYFYDANYLSVTIRLKNVDTDADFGYSQLASVDYIWTPEYDSENSEWSYLPSAYGMASTSIQYSASTGGFSSTGFQEYAYYYPLASYATLYTGETDVVTAESVEDYIGTSDDNVEVFGSPNGEYKVLFNSYEMFTAGEEMNSTTIYYTYDGEDFTITEGEEDEDVMHILVTDGLITDVYIRDIEDEETQCDDCRVKAIDLDTMIHVLQFSYNIDDQLEYVSLPDDAVTDAIRMTYDTQGNPIEFEVNPFKFKEISDGEDLALLGLSFAYDEYDSELGAVVQKYAYPDEYITMVSVDYNYGLKNFMNHTFTAMNPLLTVFDNENAIEKIGWAGHGSALLSEYTAFNDGGYPTEIKTYIQVSADDIVSGLEDEDLELDFGIPFNGSVAVTYRLDYIEKQ